MRSMAHYVSHGIDNLTDLKAALQLAMQLEFSTIPPYLCAQWSIDSDGSGQPDPSGVEAMIEAIMVQEMYHFAQVGNILSAVGGRPDIAQPSFLPSYPAAVLPGGIALENPVDMRPLSSDQLRVFEDIEHPQFVPVGPKALANLGSPPTSIGAFYDTVKECFSTLKPTLDGGARSTSVQNEVEPVKTLEDVARVIDRIKDEGEGTAKSPDQIAKNDDKIAHYYIFKQIRVGKTFVDTNGIWDFVGPDIVFPRVLEFSRASAPSDASRSFSNTLQALLTSLQAIWTTGGAVDFSDMFALKAQGKKLIQAGIAPAFVWPA